MSSPYSRAPWEFGAEDREHRSYPAPDVEQPRVGLQPCAVENQVTPVLGLLDEPLLFARAVTVDVLGTHDPES